MGLTEPEVEQILGQPYRRGKDSAPYFVDEDTDDVSTYQMNLMRFDEAMVEFKIDSMKVERVIDKYPANETVHRYLTEWKTSEEACRMLTLEILMSTAAFTYVGLILLTLASLLPLGTRNGLKSWTLYTPLMALVFFELHIMSREEGWHYDFFDLYPMCALILGVWGLRLFHLVKVMRLKK